MAQQVGGNGHGDGQAAALTPAPVDRLGPLIERCNADPCGTPTAAGFFGTSG